MSSDNVKLPGGHYSAANPIPNIQRFVKSLDKDKKERDAKINKQTQARAVQDRDGGGAVDHKPRKSAGFQRHERLSLILQREKKSRLRM